MVWDATWRLRYLTTELRVLCNAGQVMDASELLGMHYLSVEMMQARDDWPTTATSESFDAFVREIGGYLIEMTPGGLDGLRVVADSRVIGLLRNVAPEPPPAAWSARVDVQFGNRTVGNDVLMMRVQGDDSALAGFVSIAKPEVRAAVLGMLALGDTRVFERMIGLAAPARHPAAVLFANLENSAPLARRLSTPAYFDLIQRIARRSDHAVVEAGGIVGKHVGDGVTAFFLAEETGSESAAARACIESMRVIRDAAVQSAERSGLVAPDVTMRFGMHWGSTVYVGRLITSGRIEVTALGDEVNEAARIEACATGGRALASKALIERLDTPDALALGLDPEQMSYASLANLPSATDTARRDAPALAVCEL